MSDLAKREEHILAHIAPSLLDGDEAPLLKLGTRASLLAVDRWGVDLERPAGEQRYSSFEAAAEASAEDVIDYYATPDGDIEGVDGHVFEGLEVTVEALAEAAEEITDTVEAAGGFDRHAPGGIVEPVPEDERGDA